MDDRDGIPRAQGGIARAAGGRSRWARRGAIGLAVLAGLIVVADLAVSIAAAHKLTIPMRRPIRPGDRPAVYGAAYEPVRFPARGDGVAIAGWFLPAVRGRGAPARAVVLVPGKDDHRASGFDSDRLGRSRTSRFTEFAVTLTRRGYDVLMIDLRGHGQSGPARYAFGRDERRDVLGAVDWLRGRTGAAPGAVGVLGISMGAAASIGAAGADPAIGAVVADSGFAEVASLADRHWKAASGLPQAVLPTTKLAARLLFGVDIDGARPVDEVRSLRTPLLLIHDHGDPFTPVEHSRRMAAAAGPNAELWDVPCAGHAEAYVVAPQMYVDRVAGFFDRHLRQVAPGGIEKLR
jgi:dipeptidyl aminopeptidase/acylaminoacyl peptidase